MKELWLKFTDENGAPKKVLVRGEKFTIGRYPENDLCIPLSQLSRIHAEIDRFGDVFVISDNNSSNGTTINGRTVERPTAVENGDRINLGGGAELQVELISSDFEEPISPAESTPKNEFEDPAMAAADSSAVPEADSVPEVAAAPIASPAAASTAQVKPQSSGFSMFFIIAPILVIGILFFAGIMLWLFGGGGKSDDIARNSRRGGYDYPDDDKPNKNKKSDDSTETPTPSPKSTANANSSPTPEVKETQNVSTPNVTSDRDKIESNAYSFLRKIAKADQNPVLTSKQIETVSARAKSFKGSSALQGNLQDLKKKSGELETLARSKSLRPQFLATAALAQLGNKRGDVMATAQNMSSSLNQLSNLLSNDLSSDSLMIIAAYQNEAAAKSMPAKLANLTNKFPNESPQTIRTIWFLRDKNQITPEQFDFALQFLVIGTIMQNPKDFSVDTEPVTFN